MIQRIDNIGVGVRELAKSLDFYRRLGFQVTNQELETPSATVAAGEVRLFLLGQLAAAAPPA